jgi:large subunit ribosomal protein L3
MIAQLFATKHSMTQAWTKAGKRLAVTRLNVVNNAVVGQKDGTDPQGQPTKSLEIGYGKKKLKNMTKPLRSRLEKGGFSFGFRQLQQVATTGDDTFKAGDVVRVEQVLQIGDVVNVQGITKGRGFAGAMKRHGFKGGPKTHGQSDRGRAVGSIGQRTTPGRVFKGKRMPGHYGVDTQSVLGLVVLHLDPTSQEIWLSGPIPGHINSTVTLTKTGATKMVEIDQKASGITVAQPTEVAPEVTPEAATEEIASETPATETLPGEAEIVVGGAE